MEGGRKARVAACAADELRARFGGDFSIGDDCVERVALSCEGLRATTRTMHCLAWLLNHRAYFNGELSEFQLRRYGRLTDFPESDPEKLALLPAQSPRESRWPRRLRDATLALAAAWLVSRLGKPGASGAQAMYAFAGVILIMVCAGFLSYLGTPESERAAALMGHSWLVCPWAILGLSLPVMAGSFWAMKGLAPTNLPLAGAACGLFSGAIAALVYALACTEPAAPFIAIWYTLGVALCGAVGAFLGPKLLNW